MSLSQTDYALLNKENNRIYKRRAAIQRELYAMREAKAQDPKIKKIMAYYSSQVAQREVKIDKEIVTLEKRKDMKLAKLDAEIKALQDKKEIIEAEFEAKVAVFDKDATMRYYESQVELYHSPEFTETKTRREILLEAELAALTTQEKNNNYQQEQIEKALRDLRLDSEQHRREQEEIQEQRRIKKEQEDRLALEVAVRMEQEAKNNIQRLREEAERNYQRQLADYNKTVSDNQKKVEQERKQLQEKRKTAKGKDKEQIDDRLGVLRMVEKKGYTPEAMEAMDEYVYDN